MIAILMSLIERTIPSHLDENRFGVICNSLNYSYMDKKIHIKFQVANINGAWGWCKVLDVIRLVWVFLSHVENVSTWNFSECVNNLWEYLIHYVKQSKREDIIESVIKVHKKWESLSDSEKVSLFKEQSNYKYTHGQI